MATSNLCSLPLAALVVACCAALHCALLHYASADVLPSFACTLLPAPDARPISCGEHAHQITRITSWVTQASSGLSAPVPPHTATPSKTDKTAGATGEERITSRPNMPPKVLCEKREPPTCCAGASSSAFPPSSLLGISCAQPNEKVRA